MTILRVGQEAARTIALTKLGTPAATAGLATAANRALPSSAAEARPGI